jgi:glycolate oxidase iron-sulfur subunit
MTEHVAGESAVAATTGTKGDRPPRAVTKLDGEPAFDDHHPPSADIVGDCVHCGFCLPTCPTYVLWGEEMDSPRGRIYLMGQGLEGEPMTPSMVQHFDACLSCMACVTACPSGVQYDKLIEAARAQVERRYDRPSRDRALRRLVFSVFPYPRRLRLLRGPLRAYHASGVASLLRRTGVLQRISPTLAAMESLAPPLQRAERVPERVPACGPKRGTVGMLLGCVQREFFPAVNAATARVLSAEGFDVVAPARQGCCGALSAHNGREAEALSFARALVDAFDDADVDWVVVNAAGCGSTMKEYAGMLADDERYAARAARFAERVRDVSELLVEQGAVAPRHPIDVSIAYHDACHLAHAQGVRAEPRALLRDIPGLDLREIDESELCCGSAGIYAVLHPEPARELGDRKARNVLATGAQLLVTANPGCLMQVAASIQRLGGSVSLAHTVEVLDASIRGLPADALVGRGNATISGMSASTSASRDVSSSLTR